MPSAEAAQPITGRGIGYKLFVAGLIASMATGEMARSTACSRRRASADTSRGNGSSTRAARSSGCRHGPTPKHTPALSRDPIAATSGISNRSAFMVISEKGTVRGLLKPVLNQYAVGFLPVHGFSSATAVYDVAQDDDGRPLIILYVGDFDPSGMFMSEEDLPNRLAKYDGDHMKLRRIALTPEHVIGLPSFPATDKRKDPRYKWFVANYGDRCWELDAMDPNDLRDCVEQAIMELIEPVAWGRCERVNRRNRNRCVRSSRSGSRHRETLQRPAADRAIEAVARRHHPGRRRRQTGHASADQTDGRNTIASRLAFGPNTTQPSPAGTSAGKISSYNGQREDDR